MDELELIKLKKKVELLTKQLEAKHSLPQQDKVQDLQKEMHEMKNKYIFLLENMIKLQGNQKLPTEVSVSNPSVSAGTPSLGSLQVLMLLKESRATSKEFAVTAAQLKAAYNINKSERTIRNKLNYLEAHNFVLSFGKKPKVYYLTPSGIANINSQARSSLTNI